MSAITADEHRRPVVNGPSGRPYLLAPNALYDVGDWKRAIDYWLHWITTRPDNAAERADINHLLDARNELTVEDTP